MSLAGIRSLPMAGRVHEHTMTFDPRSPCGRSTSVVALAGGVMVAVALVARAVSAGGAAESMLRYEVVAAPGATELSVEMEVPPGLDAAFAADPEASGFFDGVAVRDAGRWTPLAAGRDGWQAGQCRRSGCQIRYVFHLRAAASAIGDPDTAAERGATLVGPASTWLLRPAHLPEGGLVGRLHVTTTAPVKFVTGLPRVANTPDTYSVALLPFFISPYSAFGEFDVERRQLRGADVNLAIAVPDLARDRPRIDAWVSAAARAIEAYFGRFPGAEALILVVPQRRGVHGKAMGGGGATVLLQIAPGSDLNDPAHDWMATHEMVHLAIPDLARRHLWLSEGLATYVEPLARAMTGELRGEIVWRDLVRGLPKGLPAPGDRGLDRTHTWGRTYWGGALFAFLADLEIRKATSGEKSLATGLRAVLRAGGDARAFWSIEQFIRAVDKAVGKPIVSGLYRRMADRPMPVDLPALWRDLGISVSGDDVRFDDGAPLASIRRRMVGPARGD